MEVTIPYQPFPAQEQVHQDKHRFITLVSGRRFSKTTIAINRLIKECLTVPDEYWYTAPTYKQVKLIAWELLKYYAVPKIRTKSPNETELSMHLVGGGRIRLFGTEDPDSLRGPGIRGCVNDEYSYMRSDVWPKVIRPMLTERKGWAMFLGTPAGKQNILYESYIKDPEFADPEYRNVEGMPVETDVDYRSYRFRTLDNPYIDPIEVEKARKELAPQYFRQEYEASFEEFVGQIYKEYADRHNIIVDFLAPHWAYYLGIDTGRFTAISFIAISSEDKAYVFDEIYDIDGQVRDICTQIKLKCRQYQIRPRHIIDSASQVKREYEANGIYVEDSEKEVENSIQVVRSRFKHDKLFFDKGKCRMHMLQHKSYRWSEKLVGVNKRPVPIKDNDHTCNSAQYVLNQAILKKGGESKEEKDYKKSLEYLTKQRTTKRTVSA